MKGGSKLCLRLIKPAPGRGAAIDLDDQRSRVGQGREEGSFRRFGTIVLLTICEWCIARTPSELSLRFIRIAMRSSKDGVPSDRPTAHHVKGSDQISEIER